MTPEQLKALMEWVTAHTHDLDSPHVEDTLALLNARDAMFDAFGFGSDRDGNPVARETETCQMCGRNYAPGEEHTHGCGGPSSDVEPEPWLVVQHPTVSYGYALRRGVGGEYRTLPCSEHVFMWTTYTYAKREAKRLNAIEA